jgi:hypothetical protein
VSAAGMISGFPCVGLGVEDELDDACKVIPVLPFPVEHLASRLGELIGAPFASADGRPFTPQVPGPFEASQRRVQGSSWYVQIPFAASAQCLHDGVAVERLDLEDGKDHGFEMTPKCVCSHVGSLQTLLVPKC